MKNKFLLIASLLFLLCTRNNAQVVNAGFESWKTDTTYFPGYIVLSKDTFSYSDPTGWTSSNAITGMKELGGRSLVTQSSNAYEGSSAIQMTTDTTLPVPVFGTVYTIPGFAISGNVDINITTLIAGGGITPTSIKNAGQPFTQRLKNIKGYYEYAPVYKPKINAHDTCVVWAVLKSNGKAVASALFKSGDSTGNNYQAFSADFNYISCENPDTLVIFLSSSWSDPNSQGADLVRGSVFTVDSLNYDTLSANFSFPPLAFADRDTTTKNTAKNIYVKQNDIDCDNSTDGLTVENLVQPRNGTAVVGTASAFITYTPNTDFVGLDTFYYSLSDGANVSNSTSVIVLVRYATGISEVNQVSVQIYPNPATNDLHVQFENKGPVTANIYNTLGSLVGTYRLTGNNNAISVAPYVNGIYELRLSNENNEVIARSQFSVAK